jgi:hypothetical protein
MAEIPSAVFTLGLAGVAAWLSWLAWYSHHVFVTPLAASDWDRLPVYLAPPACAVLLALSLFAIPVALPDGTIGDCFVWGFACVGLASWLTPFLGLSARDDALERRNRAAGWAIAAAQVALTLCFAGAVRRAAPGSGLAPTLFAGTTGTIALLVYWGLLEWLMGLSETITVERDGAAAARLAALLLASGVVLGQASAELGVRPLVWLPGVAVVLGAGLGLEWWCRPGPGPRSGGVRVREVAVPLVYLAAAGLWLTLV